jgi:hypothetical protein
MRSTSLVLFFAASIASAQQTSVTTRAELAAFQQTYYLHPQPELILQAITALATSGTLDDENAIAPTLGFFGEIFSANPQRLPAWKKLIAAQSKKTREVLEAALEMDHSVVLGLPERSPSMNDMYWGAFFASGRPDLLERLIGLTEHWEERKDLNLFVTGGSALWSLGSNARTHARVRASLEAARAGADPKKRERLTLALSDPGSVRERMTTILRQQHEAGQW